jgi:hypothetical protein
MQNTVDLEIITKCIIYVFGKRNASEVEYSKFKKGMVPTDMEDIML